MDPAIEHGDLRPPPPPGLSRGVLLAIVAVHVVLIAALLGSVESKRRAHEPGPASPLALAQALPADGLQRVGGRDDGAQDQRPDADAGIGAAPVTLQHAAPPQAPAEAVATAAPDADAAEPGLAQTAPRRTQAPAARRVAARPAAAPKHAVAHRVAPASAKAKASANANANAKPSFDCAKARSFAERKICSDPELARLDRELGRLYARAKRAAADPAAFQRQSDAQWRGRERTCRDRGCLVRWYAQRREQLTQALALGAQRGDRTASR